MFIAIGLTVLAVLVETSIEVLFGLEDLEILVGPTFLLWSGVAAFTGAVIGSGHIFWSRSVVGSGRIGNPRNKLGRQHRWSGYSSTFGTFLGMRVVYTAQKDAGSCAVRGVLHHSVWIGNNRNSGLVGTCAKFNRMADSLLEGNDSEFSLLGWIDYNIHNSRDYWR